MASSGSTLQLEHQKVLETRLTLSTCFFCDLRCESRCSRLQTTTSHWTETKKTDWIKLKRDKTIVFEIKCTHVETGPCSQIWEGEHRGAYWARPGAGLNNALASRDKSECFRQNGETAKTLKIKDCVINLNGSTTKLLSHRVDRQSSRVRARHVDNGVEFATVLCCAMLRTSLTPKNTSNFRFRDLSWNHRGNALLIVVNTYAYVSVYIKIQHEGQNRMNGAQVYGRSQEQKKAISLCGSSAGGRRASRWLVTSQRRQQCRQIDRGYTGLSWFQHTSQHNGRVLFSARRAIHWLHRSGSTSSGGFWCQR
jgi:hypothetical protein